MKRDHGGDLDAAIAKYGGVKSDWIDLSTGINPTPYPIPEIIPASWNSLPDHRATTSLENAARKFWDVPDSAAVLAAPGASSLIARIPGLVTTGAVSIPGPTYNEHAAAFSAQGWSLAADNYQAKVLVHPNNPDGRYWPGLVPDQKLTIIDESFCDVTPARSLINLSTTPGTLILKSFGKFWGLAGLRLGFAIGDPALVERLAELLGPWPVSGPALAIGAKALRDETWTVSTRQQLAKDASRLDDIMTAQDAKLVGGTPLFRLYHVDSAARWQDRFAQAYIWTRTFPYSDNWLRLGLPPANAWHRISEAS